MEQGPARPREPGPDDASRVAEFIGAFVRADRAVILSHDNPDPDAIASCAGLRFLVEEACGIPAIATLGGIVGRAENRALLDTLGLPFERIEGFEFLPGDAFVLVDAQPGGGNNVVPADARLAAVIDHHPRREGVRRAAYHEIREDIGACATLVVDLLRAAGLEPPRPLATGLFYAIQSETQDLGREATDADVEASIYLYPRTDPALLSSIRHARVPRDLFQSLHDGLEKAWYRGGVVCVPVGEMAYPDLVAQLADFFLRVHGVEWVVAIGRRADDLFVSVRADRPRAHAGEWVRATIAGRGPAGGHGQMAGGRVPVPGKNASEVDAIVDGMFDEFCRIAGVADEPKRFLLDRAADAADAAS